MMHATTAFTKSATSVGKDKPRPSRQTLHDGTAIGTAVAATRPDDGSRREGSLGELLLRDHRPGDERQRRRAPSDLVYRRGKLNVIFRNV